MRGCALCVTVCADRSCAHFVALTGSKLSLTWPQALIELIQVIEYANHDFKPNMDYNDSGDGGVGTLHTASTQNNANAYRNTHEQTAGNNGACSGQCAEGHS